MDENEIEVALTAEERSMLAALCREHAERLGERRRKPKGMTLSDAFHELGMANRLAEILSS